MDSDTLKPSPLVAPSTYSERLLFQIPTKYINALVIWILAGGMLTIAITRYVFSLNHPERFIDDQPSISKTSAFASTEHIFAIGMDSVAICILIAWTLAHGYNGLQIKKTCPSGSSVFKRAMLFNNICLGFGLLQGVSVFLAATVNLSVHNDLHIVFSIMAFGSGALVFVFDSFGTSLWRKQSVDLGAQGRCFKIRRLLSIAILLGACWYLYLWLFKNSAPTDYLYMAQVIYVSSEHILAFMSYSYAPLYLPELMRLFHEYNR